MNYLDKLDRILQDLKQEFGNNEPFQIITRLTEEVGELAEQVNHFEGQGIKNDKHGSPSKKELAREVQDVMRMALQIADYYECKEELKESIEKRFQEIE